MDQGRWSKQFLSNLAFYREGLKPWQRGLEIGMAHGYFLSHGGMDGPPRKREQC